MLLSPVSPLLFRTDIQLTKVSSPDILVAQKEAQGIRDELRKKGIEAQVIVKKYERMKNWLIVVTEKDKDNVSNNQPQAN